MTKYSIKYSKTFKRQLKNVLKQGKNIDELLFVTEKLANDIGLDLKYYDHALKDTKLYKGCRECHINPDWLLIYKKYKRELILVLVATGSHSKVLNM